MISSYLLNARVERRTDSCTKLVSKFNRALGNSIQYANNLIELIYPDRSTLCRLHSLRNPSSCFIFRMWLPGFRSNWSLDNVYDCFAPIWLPSTNHSIFVSFFLIFAAILFYI